MRKKEILEQLGALNAEASGLLTAENFNADRASQIESEVEKLKAELAAIERLEETVRRNALSASSGGGQRLTGSGVQVRDNKLDKPWNSAGEFFAAVVKAEEQLKHGQPIDVRLASGLNEGVSTEGGFLVGTDISNELIKQTYENTLAGRCRSIPISANSNGVEIPALKDKTRTDGNRGGGVNAYWAGEAAAYNATTPAPFEKIKLQLNKLTGLIYATDEVLADAGALQAYISTALPEEMAFKLDDAIIRGNGAGVPLGILNAPCLVTQAAEGSQTAATINAKNVAKMWSRVPARSKTRGAWFINSECFPQLQLMTSDATSAAQTVYMPPQGLSVAPFGTLFGRPVYEIEQCSALGTVGDILYCDFTQYLVATKGGMQTQTSMHVRFAYDEMAFKFTMRVDGKPAWNTYITPYKGSATQSPFVALAAR